MSENSDKEIYSEKKKESKKQRLFSFARINKYYIIPFICPVSCFLANFFLDRFGGTEGINKPLFFIPFLVTLSYVLGGLIYFISWIRTKTRETQNDAYSIDERVSTQIQLLYNDGSKVSNSKYILVFGLMTIVLSIESISAIFIEDEEGLFEERLYFIFFIPLFSRFILKLNIVNHQIFSLIIAFIGMILLFIPVFFVITTDHIKKNISNFISAICFSLLLVLCRLATQHYYVSPYLCILIIGISSTLLVFFGISIYSIIQYGNLSLYAEMFDFSNVEEKTIIIILYVFGALFFASILQIFTMLIVYYFSPTLFIVSDIISPMCSWFVRWGMNGREETRTIILNFFGYFIIIFSSLIYNEIIICNFWGLNVNTKKYTEERQRRESKNLMLTESALRKGKEESSVDDNSSYDDREK